jgi:hypothetical protein
MKFLGSAYLALFLGVGLAIGQTMQVNYYSDMNCLNYDGVYVDVTWAQVPNEDDPVVTNCYNYSYGESANIVNCPNQEICQCNFYTQEGCVGNPSATAGSGTDITNCVSSSADYTSFRCYYR